MTAHRLVLGAILLATGCVTPSFTSEREGSSTQGLTSSFYVDPLTGNDVPSGGTSAAPWKTVNYAVAQMAALPASQQAGAVLNLRGGQVYPPSSFLGTLMGTATQPIVVQPWPGSAAGVVTFDAGLPELRVVDNGAWEPVPASDGGVPGEWRTIASIPTPDGARYAWGQMMATKYRLINYGNIADLRAQNESYAVVPLSDPRPALGPLLNDPAHQTPLVYLGPGIAFVFDDPSQTTGKIHARLAPTHINAPGIVDYAGESDPNKLALSISKKTAISLHVQSQHIIFKNVIVENGGDSTLQVDNLATDVTFDHCQVYGGRFGVRVGVSGGGITFRDCTFDGGLAPWTTRSDVKDEYDYVNSDCPPPTGCHNDLGSKTNDILVIHGGSDSLYERCTFRHGHDGIQVAGTNVEIRSSLFEDLNDEVLQFGGSVVDVRVHENLVRQVLIPLSFAVNPTGGPLYIYRNVFDQRVPTRGFRTLPPDADEPYIWRFGSDVKDGSIPEVHVYQNTFITSSPVDKGSWVSLLYVSPATAPREYVNNIHLALDLDRALEPVAAAGSPAHTAGNVWFRYQAPTSPLFAIGAAKYYDLASFHADRPDWEADSLYQDPALANFTDEYFEYADGQPNTDYRPVSDVGGVPLPPGLPDVPAYAGIVHAGALPADAPPLAVGVDASTVLPTPGVPIARAGSDQTLLDADGDGFVTVALDGSASTDPDGGPLSYVWRIKGQVVSTVAAPALLLPEGQHLVRLIVTDRMHQTDSDAVVVTVNPKSPGENRLVDPGFESADTSAWTLPDGASLTNTNVFVHSGTSALKIVHTTAQQDVRQRVPITPGATYVVSGWMKTQGLTPIWSTLSANVLDASGTVLDSFSISRMRGNSPYAYAEQVILTPSNAAAIEIVDTIDAGAGTGSVLLDDLQVRDRNLLENGDFEVRSPDGSDRRAPGWDFIRPGRVADGPSLARAGRRSLELASLATNYQLVQQVFPHVSGRTYRVSAWIRTDGATTPPTLNIRRLDSGGANLGALPVPVTLSEGSYTLVERTLTAGDLPPTTASLQIEVRFEQGLPGTARFDDFLVELLP